MSVDGRANIGEKSDSGLNRMALLLSLGWVGTNLGLGIIDLPLKFLLKDQLHYSADQVSLFLALGIFTNYIKPIAGVITDSVPLFGSRRKNYLLVSLLLTGVGLFALGLVTHTWNSLLITYAIMYSMVVLTSTTLGGVMVEVGMRHNAQGRLTSQRIGMFRIGSLAGGPIGGWMAAHLPFWMAMGAGSLMHLALVPLFLFCLPEERKAKLNLSLWSATGRQLKGLVKNRTLLGAAGMIFLIAASPGFGTPLLFFQTNSLHFSKEFVGILTLVGAGSGLLATMLYHAVCKRVPLRKLLNASILIHAAGTLFYLQYHDWKSAIWITAISGVSGTLAMVPVYDLASRGTPKGSEALGYSVMMSVWNLTNSLSDWTGSTLFKKAGFAFSHLVWLNSGTTLLALLFVPFLPRLLLIGVDGRQDLEVEL